MTKLEIFHLYEKVMKKDRAAEKQLVELHRKRYPTSCFRGQDTPGSCSEYRQNLHSMYLHLTR